MDKKFHATFNHYPLNDDWQGILERYVLYGMHPGSFFEAVLSNDLVDAACRTHPSNDWREIVHLVKWMVNEAPHRSWGTREAVKEWLQLDKDERRRRCELKGVQMSAWDHLTEKELA